MYFTYTLLLTLGLVVAFPYYLVRFRRYLPTLRDRLGFLSLPQLHQSIWVHAVSVGEVKAVEKLLGGLRQQFPGKPLVVSTATPTGQQLARERRDIIGHTLYFPIDLPWCVRRALMRVDPEMVIIAETEIWPNFLHACRARDVRVVMINGRISDRSFPRYRVVRRWLRRVFEDYTIIGMQSETDRQRIEAIGANPTKVTVFGNLKYDVLTAARPVDMALARCLENWSQVWIAASTMPGEDELVLDAFVQVRGEHPDLRLVLAPRHPGRVDSVEALVMLRHLTVLRRTDLANSSGSPDVLLLDTVGELAALFHYAAVVFVGGSLVPRGGHNILEPARHRKPIVFGPHMENFREMARLFLDRSAAVRIESATELAPVISSLLGNPSHASQLGESAFSIVQQNSGATDRVLRVLEHRACSQPKV
jgi:3-deoxy-D-manno-octulosonic-acid transferase